MKIHPTLDGETARVIESLPAGGVYVVRSWHMARIMSKPLADRGIVVIAFDKLDDYLHDKTVPAIALEPAIVLTTADEKAAWKLAKKRDRRGKCDTVEADISVPGLAAEAT